MKCNCPLERNSGDRCGKPAVKFFVATYPEDNPMPGIWLHPRCDAHWRQTALPTSPYVHEISEDEASVYEIMLS